ncbi:taurine ABC transporter substrate-binding protein [Sediminicurvatus halobius]|uniref:Taurine ABC transporter substrate-binding protein n=1 Tax=Sediminicurvatus halobius TaxID=2182432 RepID=A0A2U2MXY5_9GAMM|nr:taurine ABC transporter substrate-binding protein [Spiribacter halobius]PWG61885.1 taurine ABC transporter substrate-binding protein [Spiribacter halobius]UEX79239.1 taurine ABC transporter substrate-binding protein [Spiribacter halobius]
MATRKLRMALLALTTLVLLVSTTGAAIAQNSVTVGHFGVPTPWKAAVEDGAFAEATGWDIDWRQFDSGSSVISALASGDVQLTALGSSPTAAAIGANVDLRIVYLDKVFDTAEAMVVHEDSGIVAPQDLRGKTIAAPYASTTHFHLLVALEQFNIPRAEVDIINMSPNQIAAAWERGDIDGAFVWNPVLSELLDSGRLLISSGQLANWGKPTFDAFVVDPEFAEANPEFMRDFISVVADYAARYTDNRAAWTADSAEVQLIAQNTGADAEDVPPVLNGIEFPSLERQASPLWLGGGVAEGLRATAEFLEAQGEIDSVADDYSRYVDASWVESLVNDQ